MNHSTITKLCAIANFCDEAVSALESDGAEPLVLQTWLKGVAGLYLELVELSVPLQSAPASASAPQPTGRFSGVRTPGAPAAPAPARTIPPVQAAPKNAPAAKPAPAPAQKTGHLLKITPPPLKRRKLAGM